MTPDTRGSFDFFYVARQPIVDKRGCTYGYELLFRSGRNQTRAEIENGDLATMTVATSGFISSQEKVDQSKRIFINFTERLIVEGAPRALPPTVTVIEILEDTRPSPEVMQELIKLKQDGYFIAIDDFEDSGTNDPLLDIADIIKVDVLGKTKEEITRIYKKIANKKVLPLAEKVENQNSYEFLLELGFEYFQGYFFAKPENLTGKKIRGSQTTKLRILSALNDPDINTDKLVDLVASDPSVTYRLLRLLNSAAFSFSMQIESVRHAVMLLGDIRICYWLRMVVLSDLISSDKPEELYLMALSRGKLLEELATGIRTSKDTPESLFLFGMLSLLDVMLDIPFRIIFDQLPLPDSFKEGYTNPHAPLAQYLKLLQALERDDRIRLDSCCETMNLLPHTVSVAALRADIWTDSIAGAVI